ncbi:N-acetylmuramoyl-L-alanine amidase [Streptomyces sp. NBC_01213]|uniref:peptidoglycan recognition protein family protein n=1 Tax=Streptomyces sp. NBC_01213 TaxID=2903776 RepID=UPI00352F9E83|nr:N-acetylmuramoyl-L-alanine amidase [Streptomyces sp. NBC_01213]
MTGVLIFQGVTGRTENVVGRGSDSKPVTAHATTAQLRNADDGTGASLARRDAERFSMLGVTWTDPGARVTGRVEVRTRSLTTGKWSPWLRLDGDSGQGENGAARGGTEPAWVGPSDGVEARVASNGKTSAGLPAGLRLDMVDPGTGDASAIEPAAFAVEETDAPTADPSESAEPQSSTSPDTQVPADQEPSAEPPVSESASASESPSAEPGTPSASATPTPTASTSTVPTPAPTDTGPTAPPSTMPQPPITSRAGWGADESISPEEPGYLPGGKIKAVVVHHTAESNTYTCAQAPEVVRGIYAYHVKQLGWKDVGYNFLVDKCGTIYEGRKGGVDRPVQGAHAYGFNAETVGISVLGTYTDTAPPQAALLSVARIAAWRLGQYGVDPAGTTTLTAGDAGTNYFRKSWAKGAQLPFPVIHGHRDGYNTQCPGDAFYNQLAAIRTLAAGPVSGLTVKSLTGTGLSGGKHYTKAGVTVNWSATTPAVLIKQYELLVDGKSVATTAGTSTSAKATLTIGTHTVAVRATHLSGKRTTSTSTTVIAETTAPSFSAKPALSLRTGTVNTAAVPLKLSWKATDSAALKEVRLVSPLAKTYGPTTTSASHAAKSATATAWKMTAYDYAGNATSASVSATPVILQETTATKSGTWTAKSSTSYLGGKSYSSSSKNASLTWTFTGRSAAWTVSRAATSGQAHIYVDGTKAATVDLKSSTTKYRDAIWTKTWSSSAKHTIKVVVVGTSGRPAVTTDGLVYLK